MAQVDIYLQELEKATQSNRQLCDTMTEAVTGLSKLKALCNEAETADTAEKLEFIRRCNQK